jgi:peptidase E
MSVSLSHLKQLIFEELETLGETDMYAPTANLQQMHQVVTTVSTALKNLQMAREFLSDQQVHLSSASETSLDDAIQQTDKCWKDLLADFRHS